MRFLPVLLVLFSLNAFADPLNGSLEIGTSISQSYDGRSVLTNPAALAFQSELNGADLASSFEYGVNRNQHNDFSLGVALGYLGFGWERFAQGPDTLSRYGFGLGLPLGPKFFAGARYVLNRYDGVTPGYDSVDLGLQYRAFHFLSFGALANGINRPSPGGAQLPWQLVLGATLRPVGWLDATLDADTLSGSDRFFQRWSYDATVGGEISPGIEVRVGYHQVYQYHAALTVRLGHASVFTTVEPNSDNRRVVAGFDLTATPYRSAIAEPSVLRLALNGQLQERPAPISLFSSPHPTLLGLLERLREAGKNSQIDKVILRIDSFPLGLASAEEVFRAIRELRATGKKVEAYLGNAGLKEYLIASATDKIHMEPQGELKLLGLRSEHYYVKGTLDKIGVEGEFLARGEYKSAPEMFTRRESSPINREATLEELRDANQVLEQMLTEGRQLDATKLKKVYDTALYGPNDAKAAGLVDSVDAYGLSDHDEVAAISTEERSQSLALPARIAVVVADGDILQSKNRALAVGGEAQITPRQFKQQMESALGDPRTAAIVLRVDSPGGEILPSHEMAVMVEKARQRKPVIVSMGDMAASGGYYISAPAEKIFADKLTMTGSIGVFLGKANAAGLLKWLQLNKQILSEFPHAALFSEDRPWSTADRAILTRRLNDYYEGFVGYVAKNRHLDVAAAEKAAKGRVWLGSKALGWKLVDENGGYREAIQYAAKRAGVDGDYEVYAVPESVGLLDMFSGDMLLGVKSAAKANPLEAYGLLSHPALRQLRWMASLQENPFLYLSPQESL